MQKPNSKLILRISLVGNLLFAALLLAVVYWMGGWKHLMHKVQSRGLSEEYEMKKSQIEILPISETEVLFLGNSLTEQGNWQEWLPEYRVINRGIGGDGVEGIKSRLADVAKFKPGMLFLMIGINDLAYHSPSWLIAEYDILLREIKVLLPGTKVCIQSILPVNNSVKETGYSNEIIGLVNKDLSQMAQRYEFCYLDLHPIFANESGELRSDWTLDGIHLKGEAYKAWANYLEQQMTKLSPG